MVGESRLKAMLLWKERTGQSYKTYGGARRWSKWEIMKQLIDLFGDVEPFLQKVTLSPATVEKLLSALRNTNKKKLPQVELAATNDASL